MLAIDNDLFRDNLGAPLLPDAELTALATVDRNEKSIITFAFCNPVINQVLGAFANVTSNEATADYIAGVAVFAIH
jgi:hypothetical protein